MHLCPECGKTMASIGGLEIHAEIAHRLPPPVADQPAPSFVDVSLPGPRPASVLSSAPTRTGPGRTPMLRGYDPTVPLTALLVLALLLVGVVVALHRSSTASVPPAPHAAVVVSQG